MQSTIRTLIVWQAFLFLPVAYCQQAPAQIPMFQVDSAWPKMPSKWVFGLVSGVVNWSPFSTCIGAPARKGRTREDDFRARGPINSPEALASRASTPEVEQIHHGSAF